MIVPRSIGRAEENGRPTDAVFAFSRRTTFVWKSTSVSHHQFWMNLPIDRVPVPNFQWTYHVSLPEWIRMVVWKSWYGQGYICIVPNLRLGYLVTCYMTIDEDATRTTTTATIPTSYDEINRGHTGYICGIWIGMDISKQHSHTSLTTFDTIRKIVIGSH